MTAAVLLAGCDYWPPALQTQIEQLRSELQTVTMEKAQLQNQMTSLAKAKDDLQMQVDDLSRSARRTRAVAGRKPVPQRDQNLVDQFELPPGPLGIVAGDVVQDRAKLAGDGINQPCGHATVQRPHFRAAGLEGFDGSCQAFSEQQVVETVGKCHAQSLLQPMGRAPRRGTPGSCIRRGDRRTKVRRPLLRGKWEPGA